MRWISLAVALLLALSSGAAPRKRTVQTVERRLVDYSTPAGNGSLALAPDGTVWSIGVDVGPVVLDKPFAPVAMGANCWSGAAFFSSDSLVCASNTSFKLIDQNGVRMTIETDFVSDALIALPDGTVLFTKSSTELGRITREGVISAIPLPAEIRNPAHPVVAADGAVWFIARQSVVRMLSDSSFEVFTADSSLFAGHVPGTPFSGLVARDDGSLLLSIQTDGRTSGYHHSGAIVSFTPADGFRELRAVNSPKLLAEDPDGSLWFTQGAPSGFVPNIDALVHLGRDGSVTTHSLPMGLWPLNVAGLVVDPRGRVWVSYADSWRGPRVVVLQ